MKFIQECDPALTVGVLAQFNSVTNLLEIYSTGRIVGLVTKVFTTNILNPDDTTSEVSVAEITTHGESNVAVLSGSASWKGCELYANSDGHLSALVNGESIAILIPRHFGEDKVDFIDGEVVNVVMEK